MTRMTNYINEKINMEQIKKYFTIAKQTIQIPF